MPVLRCEFYVFSGEHLDLFCLWTCGWHRHMNAWTKSTTIRLPHQSLQWHPIADGRQAALLQRVFCAGLTPHVLNTCWGIPITVTGAAAGTDGPCSRDCEALFFSALQGQVEENPNSSFSTQLASSPVSWKWPVLTLEGWNHTFISCWYSGWRGQAVARYKIQVFT